MANLVTGYLFNNSFSHHPESFHANVQKTPINTKEFFWKKEEEKKKILSLKFNTVIFLPKRWRGGRLSLKGYTVLTLMISVDCRRGREEGGGGRKRGSLNVSLRGRRGCARTLPPPGSPERSSPPVAWNAAPSRWGRRNPAPRWWTACGWSLAKAPVNWCPQRRTSGRSHTAARTDRRRPAPPSFGCSLWIGRSLPPPLLPLPPQAPPLLRPPGWPVSTAAASGCLGRSRSSWPLGSHRDSSGRSCRKPACPAPLRPRRCTWWHYPSCPPRPPPFSGPFCGASGSESAGRGLMGKTDKTRRKKREETITHKGTKETCLPICNQHRKRPFFFSPTAHYPQVTMVQLEQLWKFYTVKENRPHRMEEAETVKRESDRSRDKKAFTQWRAPVLCQSLFLRWYVLFFEMVPNQHSFCWIIK